MTSNKHNFFYKTKAIHSIVELISCYGNHEFYSPLRSTIPLIQLIFHNPDALRQIIPDFDSCKCVFEYETPVQKGKGLPSCTDLMIYNDNEAYCIEAKRTEPMYEKVSSWLQNGRTEHSGNNRIDVLNGWLKLINDRCTKSITVADVPDFTYQTIHRFASACKMSGNSEMDYFIFKSEHDEDNHKAYLSELKKLTHLCGNEVPVRLVLFDLFSNDAYHEMENNYQNNRIDYSNTIKQMLLEEKVFTVLVDRVINVSQE